MEENEKERAKNIGKRDIDIAKIEENAEALCEKYFDHRQQDNFFWWVQVTNWFEPFEVMEYLGIYERLDRQRVRPFILARPDDKIAIFRHSLHDDPEEIICYYDRSIREIYRKSRIKFREVSMTSLRREWGENIRYI